MSERFLFWVSEPARIQTLKLIEGQKAIRFPAAYFPQAPKAQSLLWRNLLPIDSQGRVVKTAPDALIQGLIQFLESQGVTYELMEVVQ